MQLPFQMDAGGHVQEACSCCWHLSSPVMFLTPGSPWPHHTHSQVHGLQGLGAASAVRYGTHAVPSRKQPAGCAPVCNGSAVPKSVAAGWEASSFLPSQMQGYCSAFFFCFLSHAVLSNVQSKAHAHIGFNTAGSHCHTASLLQ